MKFTPTLILLATAFSSIAVGAPTAETDANTDVVVARAAFAEANANAAPAPAPALDEAAKAAIADVGQAEFSTLAAGGLTIGQCRAACRGGATAMNRFCRLIPQPVIRAGCWATSSALLTPTGQIVCTNWCAWWF